MKTSEFFKQKDREMETFPINFVERFVHNVYIVGSCLFFASLVKGILG